MASFLDRERTVAGPGFNRWLVPPAAIAVQMSIGEIYGFSVFNVPLTRVVGVTESVKGEDWTIPQVGWVYSLGLIMLGLSAAVLGKWVERSGPRKTMFTASCCFSGGLCLASLGVALHQIGLVYLGYGLVGGIGLGLGYIAPVSTLVKWFPDRPGMATGMAIMGFGGGALVGAPFGVELMARFKSPTSVGVREAFLVMAAAYFVMMNFGTLLVRVPAADWKPEGFVPQASPRALVATSHVLADEAIKTPQFWLLWAVLCLNVTAGIGVLGIASPMVQEIFKGRVTASAAAGFTGLLSLFNIGGRIFWASLSDRIGRRATYTVFFALGMLLYASAPTAGASGSLALFVAIFCVILTMYGGGFATIPAYLADLFGVGNVSAIHGRLLTAWSTAGIVGPVLVNYIREFQIAHGVAPANAYTFTMYILVAFLGVGLICNLAVRPVAKGLFTLSPGAPAGARGQSKATIADAPPGEWGLVAVGWLLAGLPIGWGVFRTLTLVSQMFR
jgi:MFS family permease